MAFAESLIAETIRSPLFVTRSNKIGSIRFMAEYDARHFLVAPVKVSQWEMWLESLYIRSVKDFVRDFEAIGVLHMRG